MVHFGWYSMFTSFLHVYKWVETSPVISAVSGWFNTCEVIVRGGLYAAKNAWSHPAETHRQSCWGSDAVSAVAPSEKSLWT